MSLLIVLDIDYSLLELPGRNLAVEEDIKLTVRAVLHFRQEEVCQDPAHNRGAAPDETTLARHVPTSRVEQLRRQVDHGNFGNVVRSATDTGAQSAKAHRGRLGDDGVGDGAEGACEDERDDDAEDGLCVICRAALGDRGADSQNEEEGDVSGCAPEVDGAAAEPAADKPGAGVGDKTKT